MAAPAAGGAAGAAVNVSELRAVLRQPAATAGDRFRVLDARDKLHRAGELRTEEDSRGVGQSESGDRSVRKGDWRASCGKILRQ